MELTDAQKIVMDHERKEYDIKFKTWAIDRVLEMLKVREEGNILKTNAETIIDQAEKLCAWICASPKQFAIPNADEAETMAAHIQNVGGTVQ